MEMMAGKRLIAASLLALSGCTGQAPARSPSGQAGQPGPDDARAIISPPRSFRAALDMFAEHDQKNDWSDESCAAASGAFLGASEAAIAEGAPLPGALYNAGLALRRCGRDEAAARIFEKTLALDPSHHEARTQLALISYQQGGDGALGSAIQSLEQAVRDASFRNVEALVGLAALRMKRGASQGGAGCQDDLDCARLDLQRALAIDEKYMPAFNQLALYYLGRARARGGVLRTTLFVEPTIAPRRHEPATWSDLARLEEVPEALPFPDPSSPSKRKADARQLELAALVCSQATRKNPKYPPIHNTAGLIQVELGNMGEAARSFEQAASLDPRFFEARMNHGAINLSFRGFKNAEVAYREAAALRPHDYDAQLGLALALRGQITDANLDEGIKATQQALDRAREIAPDRPEAYYNEGLLLQGFKARTVTDGREQLVIFRQARQRYQDFIARAGSSPDYAGVVKTARERIDEIDDMVRFISKP